MSEPITFIPPITEGTVIKVYDGDTITVTTKMPGMVDSPLYKFSVRLNHIDTPELRTNNAEEKEMAKKARDALSERILGKVVHLRDVQLEKYGRILCDVYYDDECMNDWMVNQRYAVKYEGKTKKSPPSWKAYYNNEPMVDE